MHQQQLAAIPSNNVGSPRPEGGQISTSSRSTSTNQVMEIPVEVLRMILRLVYPNQSLYQLPHPKQIIALSSVCRLWRDIVINDPTFWSAVKLPSKPALIQMSISRSCQVPLLVDINIPASGPRQSNPLKPSMGLVFAEYHRLKKLGMELGVFAHSGKVWKSVRSVMTRSAPMLEALSLRTFQAKMELDGLLKGGAPQLKTLNIMGRWIPRLSLTSLRVLGLSIDFCVNDTQSYENVFDLLMTNPQLESLSLSLRFASILPNPNNTRTIHLPSLKNLCLRTHQSHLSDILQGLVFPSDIPCVFGIDQCDSTGTTDLFDAILSQTPLVGLTIAISDDGFGISPSQLHSKVSASFSYDVYDEDNDARPPFVPQGTILSKFDLSSVTTFSLRFFAQYHPLFNETETESIKNLLRVLISLRKLTVAYRSDYEPMEQFEYLDALMHPVGSDGPSLPCPLLAELEIDGLEALSLPYANQLKQCILVRSDANCPFSKVRLISPDEPDLEVRTLLDGLVEWEEETLLER